MTGIQEGIDDALDAASNVLNGAIEEKAGQVVEVVKANTTTQAKQLMAVVAVPRLPLTS